MTSFGPHLMLDCKKCNDKIGDLQFVFDFLNELPDKIGMTKITQPYVFPYSGLVPEDKGITGTVIIAESHITFHSFVEKDYFFFDIFSCKPFDVAAVEILLLDAFGVQEWNTYMTNRGEDFPREMNITQWSKERAETGEDENFSPAGLAALHRMDQIAEEEGMND